MSASCESKCPIIQTLKSFTQYSEVISKEGNGFKARPSTIDALNRAVERSNGCAGPIFEPLLVSRDPQTRQIIFENTPVCRMDTSAPVAQPSLNPQLA